jgi:ribosome-binding protein aMBF1 (putative translation factor)
MTIPFDTLRRKWMKDPKFRAEYESIGPGMELAMTLAEARRKAGLTQAELATRMKTSQAAVARIESGHGAPKWDMLRDYINATIGFEALAAATGMPPKSLTRMF